MNVDTADTPPYSTGGLDYTTDELGHLEIFQHQTLVLQWDIMRFRESRTISEPYHVYCLVLNPGEHAPAITRCDFPSNMLQNSIHLGEFSSHV